MLRFRKKPDENTPEHATAKVRIAEERLFEKVTAYVKAVDYVKCGLCGAVKVDAKEVARILYSLKDYRDDAYEELNEAISELLGEIIEYIPDEFTSAEEWEKWESANKHRIYPFLDDYGDMVMGKYDELVIFHDPVCNCFSKDTIKDA